LEGGPPGFPRGFPCPAVLGPPAHGPAPPFAYGALTPSGQPSQVVRLNSATPRRNRTPAQPAPTTPPPQRVQASPQRWFGLFPLRSPLLGESLLISCPPATKMFQFAGWPPTCLCVQQTVAGLHPAGFPHSDIPGSTPVCGSPRLFAACRVLLRPKAPRHPPYALAPLTAPRITRPAAKRALDTRSSLSSRTPLQLPRCKISKKDRGTLASEQRVGAGPAGS
jgi:hypothetical protein